MNKENSLKVSIITVVLNAEDTIEKAINSVLEQSYDNIEYIIVDGLSSDGTSEIISKYRDRISCYIRESDSGIYDAMNKGIRIATGDVIGILNADDWYEAGAVEEAVSIFDNDPDCMIAAGRIREHNMHGDTVISNVYPMSVIWMHMPFPHPASFVRKNAHDLYGEYDTSYKICADYDFFFRLFVNDVKACTSDNIWSNFRQGGASTSNFINTVLESNLIRRKYGESHPSLIEKDKLESICEKELLYAYLHECYYRKPDLLTDVLNEMYPAGIRIYGFGNWGKMIVRFCMSHGIDVIAVYDRNQTLWGKEAEGIQISSPNDIGADGGKDLFVAILYDGPMIGESLLEENELTIHTIDDLSKEIRDRMKEAD